jgi:hypothetical protein
VERTVLLSNLAKDGLGFDSLVFHFSHKRLAFMRGLSRILCWLESFRSEDGIF